MFFRDFHAMQCKQNVYVEDFEGTQTNIDLRSPFSWYLSSTPIRPTTGVVPDYFDFGGNSTTLDYGFKRAKLAWYTIDPIFYAQRPSGISDDDLSLNSTRRIYSQELYPATTIAAGQTQVVNTLDLTYFPKESFHPSFYLKTLRKHLLFP
jgi:cell surface protein SprA